MKELFQSADWKAEKHVPVINAPEKAGKGEMIEIKITVGQEIAHPNTTAHHISWVEVYFKPEGDKFPYHIARADFSSHGASAQGADSSSVYTDATATVRFKSDKSGVIHASGYCNIHGLWSSEKAIAIE